MDWEEFLKPTKWNLMLLVILVSLSILYQRPNYCFDANCYPRGFPLPFIDDFQGSLRIMQEKYIVYFLVDIIFWYFISSIVLFFISKLKN